MIFGIVVLHTPPYIPLAETGPGAFDFIKAMFQHAIFRASVPVLTFISGYLLFRSQLDLQFKRLLLKKTRTILIPLIIFNLPIAVAVYLLQANDFGGHAFSKDLHPFGLPVWIDALVGLFTAPINYPLNFLRDLYILSLLAPILGIMLRRAPWAGLAIVFVIFWFNLEGAFILRNTMPIVFYIGGMAALQKWDLSKMDPFAVHFLIAFLLICSAVVLFDIENRNYLRLAAPALIWPAASLLVKSPIGTWIAGLSKYSFLTFLAHGPLLLVAFLAYENFMTWVPYWIFWVGTPLLVAVFLARVHIYSYRFFPKAMNVLLGGR
jgi:succinoglycan biosynthesis protein ExoH